MGGRGGPRKVELIHYAYRLSIQVGGQVKIEYKGFLTPKEKCIKCIPTCLYSYCKLNTFTFLSQTTVVAVHVTKHLGLFMCLRGLRVENYLSSREGFTSLTLTHGSSPPVPSCRVVKRHRGISISLSALSLSREVPTQRRITHSTTH